MSVHYDDWFGSSPLSVLPYLPFSLSFVHMYGFFLVPNKWEQRFLCSEKPKCSLVIISLVDFMDNCAVNHSPFYPSDTKL